MAIFRLNVAPVPLKGHAQPQPFAVLPLSFELADRLTLKVPTQDL